MITIKSEEEIKIMAEGGRILAEIMKDLEKMVKPGITTNEINRAAEALIFKFKGKCSFKGYKDYDNSSVKPFPACLCASVNEEIVHVIPSDRVLKEGDIFSLDLGIKYQGFHSDMAVTVPVGNISSEASKLIFTTKESLKKGIEKAISGNTFGDIGNAIQKYVEAQGFNVVRELCGHGIGRDLHEEPQILNYGKKGSGFKIKEGMVFCLEPMVTIGDWRIKSAKDGFGLQTQDSSLSAHFEHTIAVTKNGVKILTLI